MQGLCKLTVAQVAHTQELRTALGYGKQKAIWIENPTLLFTLIGTTLMVLISHVSTMAV